MKINKLKITNFKLFIESEFKFHPNFNLIVGVNGRGKTSLLRAVSVALGGWAHAYIKDKNNLRPIQKDEIRQIETDGRFDNTKTVSIQADGDASIVDLNGEFKGGHAIWWRILSEGSDQTVTSGDIKYGSYPQSYNLNFEKLGASILSYIEKGKYFDLPLIAFYECNRLWSSDNNQSHKGAQSALIEEVAKKQYSRFHPYQDCFHTALHDDDITEWLLKNELVSLQDKKDNLMLQSLREAAKAAIEGCTGLKYSFEEGRVLLNFEDGTTVPFEHLSDGQRTMLGLFCDMARRVAILNPHLGAEASSKTSGVVLIDELDLHLHPKWQRGIIENLRKTFPKVQFICTTHSPFLIQSLRIGKLIRLDSEFVESEPRYYDQSIEDIAEEAQGIELVRKTKRYSDMKAAAKAYYKKLHEIANEADPEVQMLKQRFDELTIPFNDDPAFAAFLEFERDTVKAKAGVN